MKHFWTGFEKRAFIADAASKVKNWAGGLKPAQWYKTEAARPGFKIKKTLSRAAIGVGAGGYGLHKITEAPNPVNVPQA